ncbi:type II secretion system secretin GspD [Polaromonas sp. CG_9.11]|uniref:type II secretion system secretin GspD n=1 Tax=Polaromonas sp. CG_9.11 TaxID=2787730 RepID=UPI0018CB0E2F|nr:type II secretion system secretin GspD [Polaromonas sp. CG_9.11]
MKHPNFKQHQLAIFSIAGSALLACGTGLFPLDSQAQPQVASPAAAGKRGEAITLNFVNANIDAVARTMATLTGRNVVVDPRVKGTITLTTERPVSPAVAYSQFLAILRLQGFTVVNAAGLDKIVPEADAKLQGGAVSTNVPVGGGQIATTIFKLSFENANNLLPILRPLISPNNTINVNPGNNSLVITDYADNLNRLGRIIAALDVANATNVELLPVRYASVTDLAPLLTRLLDNSAGGGVVTAEASYKTTVLAEPRSNSLIVRAANGARLELVKSLLKTLDTPSMNGPNGDAGNIYVVYLKNADATNLATVLRASMTGGGSASPATPQMGNTPAMNTAGQAGTTSSMGQPSSAATAPITPSAGPSTGGQIQADPSTNSLIITASEPQYRQLRAVIEKLDARRAQVYVESLIAEVNMDKAAEFGIQWQGPLGGKGDSLIGLLGTNFGSSGKNIIQSALGASSGTPLPPGTGLNLGVAARSNGVYFLGFLANFLQTSGAGNILSTPNLITLDNEEAKIIIGQNVPFVTGQFTNTGSGGSNGSVNPFQTIERKDVGLTLRVKPQISENGTVKMAIFQEVSSVQPGSVNSATGLITNKRSIESHVLVEDGAIIVLGGLLQDEYSGNQDKVPGLGDVPVFGNLFKSESRSRKKTNLMVFLRPVVVRDAASTNALSMDRYDLMRTTQQQTQPVNSSLVPVNESPVLPAITPMPAVAPARPVAAPLFQTAPLPLVNDR